MVCDNQKKCGNACPAKAVKIPIKKTESVFLLVFILTFVCLGAGVLLSFTFNQTKDKIADAEQQAALELVKVVLPEFDGEPIVKKLMIDGEEKEFYIGSKNGFVTGIATRSNSLGYGGTLTILVGVDTDEKISGVALLSHQETPGLGAKAGDANFLEQFKNKTLKEKESVLTVKKDGGEIEAITAATITSRAVAKAATKALRIININKKELVS